MSDMEKSYSEIGGNCYCLYDAINEAEVKTKMGSAYSYVEINDVGRNVKHIDMNYKDTNGKKCNK